MTKKIFFFYLTSILLYLPLVVFGQQQSASDFNLGFESISKENGWPYNWTIGGNSKEFQSSIDSTIRFSGKYSMKTFCKVLPSEVGSGHYVSNTLPAIYEGNTIEVSAYIKTNHITGPAFLYILIAGDAGRCNING
jgi:hypothetical protein